MSSQIKKILSGAKVDHNWDLTMTEHKYAYRLDLVGNWHCMALDAVFYKRKTGAPDHDPTALVVSHS